MRCFLIALLGLAMPALAAEPVLRPSARLLFKAPEMLQAGHCVAYEEGGAGWGSVEPEFYLRGVVVASEVQTRHLQACPTVPGKNFDQYTRDEFNRHALAFPCLAAGVPVRDEQIGIVRLRVTEWETPHAARAANVGRLFRGMFVDRKLEKNMEIELEADLLGLCR